MEKANLFEDFGLENNDNNKLLGKKRNKKDEEDEENQIVGSIELKKESNDFSQVIISQNEDTRLENKLATLLKDQVMISNDNIEFPDMTNVDFKTQGCHHECFYPRNLEIKDLKQSTTPPAKVYQFKLDPFQERAILCLENEQSVLVAAHTSAGKTVVAEYAIAKAIKNNQRVIYTSPIKALSNQKFRELEHEFSDVGLMTGDVTINKNATCIVMTTEILRNMLYRGSDITREMACVIFDEVHYMRDKDRGVIWEECIIMLPNIVKFVFLSATIPNAKQFAEWICTIKSQPCHVVSTELRPVPLKHFVYPKHFGIFNVTTPNGKFSEEKFNQAIDKLSDEQDISTLHNNKKRLMENSKENAMRKLISLIQEKHLEPAIFFTFSKSDCEKHAISLISSKNLCLTSEEERDNIHLIYSNAISTLSDEDQKLPQILMVGKLLSKGIGVHHGGLLPIIKEAVELLFQEGLLKVLFSTETFSMGINMPARTVVFTSIEKWDGEEHRWLSSGEYIQMSGRAGRRGKDDKGFVIMMLDKKIDPEICGNMISGRSDPLNSSFKLSYNMLVNLMRIEGFSPEYLVKRSFKQYQSERSVPELINSIKNQFILLKSMTISKEIEAKMQRIKQVEDKLTGLKEEIRQKVINSKNCLGFLKPGRMIKVADFKWGILLNYYKKLIEVSDKGRKVFAEDNQNEALDIKSNTKEIIILDTLVFFSNRLNHNRDLLPVNDIKSEDSMLGVVPIVYSCLEEVGSLTLNFKNKDLKDQKVLKDIQEIFSEILVRYKYEPPVLDPIKDMNIKNQSLSDMIDKQTKYFKILQELKSDLNLDKSNEENLTKVFKEKLELRSDIQDKINKLSVLKDLVLNDNLIKMKKVLKHFDLTNNEIVIAKGQVACLISSTDEILLTEMLYNSQFNDIEPAYLAAMLSCFLVEEKEAKKDQKPLKNNILRALHERIMLTASRVVEVLIEKRLDIDREKYLKSLRWDIMEAVLDWCNGAKFADIVKNSEMYEGTLIRSMRRLDELIKQVSESAMVIGNITLKEKLDKGNELLHRGIVFSASLYLSDLK